MAGVLVVVVLIVLAETLVWRYGADSRDGNDWVAPKPCRESPLVG